MTTAPTTDPAEPTWEELLSDYGEWFDSTVARVGGYDKFLFRVAHRARRIDSGHDRSALWCAPMYLMSRDQLIDSSRGWQGPPEEEADPLPPADAVIRQAVTMLLERTVRTELSPDAARWNTASALVEAILSHPGYRRSFEGKSHDMARLEYGSALVRAGQYREALPLLFRAYKNLRSLAIGTWGLVEEEEKKSDPGNVAGLRSLWCRWLALEVEAGLAIVRALLELGEVEDALEVLTEDMGLETPGSGVEFVVPEDRRTYDYDFTYWKYESVNLAYEAWDASMLRNHIVLHLLRGEALARMGRLQDAIDLWCSCLDAAQTCADEGREDITTAIAEQFHSLMTRPSDATRMMMKEPHGLHTLRRAVSMYAQYHERARSILRGFSPQGMHEVEVSDIEIEINELELAVGKGYIEAVHELSLAMRDNGSIRLADGLLEQAVDAGAPLAFMELGFRLLDEGDEERGITLLGKSLGHPQCGAALERIASWSLKTERYADLLKWAPGIAEALDERQSEPADEDVPQP